jgi:hypothetical protein
VGGVAAQFFTNTGAVLTGGKLYTYAAGTTTPATAYTTSAGNVPWTNPIVLDAAGRVPSGGEIWITDGINYKFILRDSNDVLIATYDNISGINSNFISFTNQQQIITATANQTVFNLSISYQPGTNSLSVFVDGVNQYGPGAQYAYTETDSDTVTFVSGLHVGAQVKFTTTQQQGAGAVDSSQVTYDPPFTGSVATNVEAKLAQTVSVKDFGAVGDGLINDAAACVAANTGANSVFYPIGTYYIDTNITLTKPITMTPGAQFLIAAGKTLTINAPVYAGSRQYIFNGASGSVTGTFGNVDLWVDWFGAVPDSSISSTPTGTNSGIGINKALVAANNSGTRKGVVKLNQGVYLTETAIVSPSSGVTIEGTGKYTTTIVTKSAFTGSVITLSGAGGPPSILRGLNINSAIGGSYSSTVGINANTNGVFISDVWVSGFLTGVFINNTEVFLDDFICEYNVTGVSVKRQSVNISNGVTYANQSAGILFSDVPVANANRVVVSNIRSSFDVAVGFYATNSNGITLTGCAVNSDSSGQYSDSGFKIDGTSSDIIVNGCSAYIISQKTTSNGFFVTDSATDIQIKDCSAENWQYGFRLQGGGNTSISDCQTTNNFLYGIYASNFQNISIINNQCFANGSAAAADAGIRAVPSAANSRLLIANNISSATGGAAQDYGIYVTNNTASIYGLVAVNIAQNNNVSNILVDGTSSANITLSTNITV